MEQEVLAERSPLYGRRTGQLYLMSLSYRDSGDFFSEYSAKQKLIAYGILGGIPAYLTRFVPHSPNASQKTFEQHIKDELLSPQGYLFDEVNFLLRMELREPRTYASMLQAIATGATRLNEISQRVGLNPTDVNKYLNVLRELGLIRRETRVTERAPEKSKRGLYKIEDNYVKFWFRFVLPRRSLIEFGNADLVYQQMIVPHLSQYMGEIFEGICRQYISLYWAEKLQIAPKRVGGHWESDFEIDILTENIDGSHWFGECKWWNAPVGENVLNHLIESTTRVPDRWKRHPRYALFSANGFTDTLKQRAEKEGVLLVEVNDLF